MTARAEIVGLKGDNLRFDCPGCREPHIVVVPPHPNAWDWNGDVQSPTLSPSILVQGGENDVRCHSFVRGGVIEFLLDCSHDLAGQSVQLPGAGAYGY